MSTNGPFTGAAQPCSPLFRARLRPYRIDDLREGEVLAVDLPLPRPARGVLVGGGRPRRQRRSGLRRVRQPGSRGRLRFRLVLNGHFVNLPNPWNSEGGERARKTAHLRHWWQQDEDPHGTPNQSHTVARPRSSPSRRCRRQWCADGALPREARPGAARTRASGRAAPHGL